MSAWAWVAVAGGGVLAALAATADGAVFSELPAAPFAATHVAGGDGDTRVGERPDHTRWSDTPPAGRNPASRGAEAREHAHRALSFARLVGHGIAGGALAVALGLNGRATVGAVIGLVLMGLIVVTLAETVSRAIGDALGETAAHRLHWFIRGSERILAPVVTLGAAIDRAFAEVVSEASASSERREEAAAQFREVIATEADVSRDERELLLGVFDFGETTVEEVMVPRVDIEGIEHDTPWSEAVDRVRSARHSRMPVYDSTLDEIVGIVYAKDLLPFVLDDNEPANGWQTLMRAPVFIPPSKRIADMLREFRATGRHIAIVADEYGGTAGLVTIEDILEELVGEIRDEYDEEERLVESDGDARFWVSGRLTLDDLSEALGHDFRREDVSTVGGLVLDTLGRVPRSGETLAIGPFRVIVERVVRRKIQRVFLQRVETDVAADLADGEDG